MKAAATKATGGADGDRALTMAERRQVARCVAYGQVAELIEWAVAEALRGRGPLADKLRLSRTADGEVGTWGLATLAIAAELSKREARAYDRLGPASPDDALRPGERQGEQ